MTSHEDTPRILRFLTQPPRSPFRQLALSFGGLALAGALLIRYVPSVGSLLVGVPLADAGSDGLRDLLSAPLPDRGAGLVFGLRMVVVMLSTLFITIPTSWGYMAIRERSGYEQTVVQTLVILPVVVAGIMLVVQNSLALAFALGGVAAAVRFRNTLKDVSDATYVFLAIGLGIAAGSGALVGTLAMATLFTFVSVGLWRCNFGQCALTAREAANTRRAGTTALRGQMAIDVDGAHAKTLLESVLDSSAKQWKLRNAAETATGATRLQYRVRLRRSVSIEALTAQLEELSASGIGQPDFTWRPTPHTVIPQ